MKREQDEIKQYRASIKYARVREMAIANKKICFEVRATCSTSPSSSREGFPLSTKNFHKGLNIAVYTRPGASIPTFTPLYKRWA